MSLRNEVTADGFITRVATTEAQLVMSVSETVTTAVAVTGATLPVGPVVLRVDSAVNTDIVKLSADHVVLGNTLVVANVDSGQDCILKPPTGGSILGGDVTVGNGEAAWVVCVDATAGASVWAKIKG